jgi:hypothetical protein
MACLALVLLAALQLGLPAGTELPQEAALAPRRLRELAATPVPAYPALAASDVFSPDRDAGAADAASIHDCALVGVVSIGRRAQALVKAGRSPAHLVPLGATVCGWRLARLDTSQATFDRAGQHVTLLAGQAPPAAPSAPSAADPSQGEEPAQ